MKKETMKTKLLARLAVLGLVAVSMGSTVIAQAQITDYGADYGTGATAQVPNQQVDAYSHWCDEVTQELMVAQSLGWNLFNRQLYTQARAHIMTALQNALNSMNIPGGKFRPATYNEIVRTMELVRALDATNSNIPGMNDAVLKAKTIAYVALKRVSYITYVKDVVDMDYRIPCRLGCGGGYDYSGYQDALAMAATEQLSRAQEYTTVVGADGMVYPINDTPFYFVIISKAARWAAEDLSMNLFRTTFSCAIRNLRTLGTRAATYQAMLGDVAAVQEISAIVNQLIAEMSYSPYGCGYRFPVRY